MRLIDGDALLKMIENGLLEPTGRAVPFNAGVAFAVSMVTYAPTIDAEPVKHGRWIRWVQNRDEWPAAMCSECQDKVEADNEGKYPNYCPNCGALMQGGTEDEID